MVTAPAANEARDEQITVRLPAHLVEKVDAKVVAMRGASPGVTVTRSDAFRALLLMGLASE